MAPQRTDLLLVNASNYPAVPVYPYAFVQLSAMAARHGIGTARLDLLGVAREEWPRALRAALDRAAPRVVGVHLRQADSIFIWNYVERALPGAPPVNRLSYWPVDDTEHLVRLLREATDAPIMIGGFGFTTHARAVVERLAPDFGVTGEPDAVLAGLDAVLERRDLDRVPNLVHRRGDGFVFNERVFYPPPAHTEYDETILADLAAFYGERSLSGPDAPHVPVELMRGCPHRCYFCTEPTVKGRRHRVRDLDVVMRDVGFLADREVARVWLVCSEINIGGNALLLEMAGRFEQLNHGRARPVAWSAYLLPNPALTREQIRYLLEARFEPGWNQFTSYHDPNLKKTRVPYRTRHALAAQLDWVREERRYRHDHGLPERPARLDMFLGNSYSDAETVAETLRVADEAGVARHFEDALITRATRVFDLGQGMIGDAGDSAFSVGPGGRLDGVDLLYPTFSYPEALVRELGDEEAVDVFFAHVEATYLSTAHQARLDWTEFLRAHGRPAPEGADAHAHLVDLVAAEIDQVRAAFAAIGLEGYWDARDTWSSYRVYRALAPGHASAEALLDDLARRTGHRDGSVPVLAVRACLYAHNVVLRPDYARLLLR
ncbi:B12-binding domain-containing radical SAM protein [Spirillospora sp. CA-294931]|uniref:B12-binding domain-containing radical SAM protein n=1 Tax=Spirillospora sp. CA-294931 TaxID=3240042 RepID=UPI003D91E2FE